MTNKQYIPSLDQLDMRLIAELETDASQTNTSLATKLGVDRTTIANRVQRLIDGNIIRPFCWFAPTLIGYRYAVIFLINVQHGCDSYVADKLAANLRVSVVCLCTGRFSVHVWAQFRTGDDMLDFITNDLKPIKGIHHVEKLITIEEIKASAIPLTDVNKSCQPESPTKVVLDDLDFKLIRELQRDARQSSSELGRKLGIYQSTIFRRMRKLVDNHIIKIGIRYNPSVLGYEVVALMGMKSYLGKAREVAHTLASYDQVQYVNLCVGRYDLTTYVAFRSLTDLSDFINVELAKIPGLRDIETMLIYKTVKMSFDIEI